MPGACSERQARDRKNGEESTRSQIARPSRFERLEKNSEKCECLLSVRVQSLVSPHGGSEGSRQLNGTFAQMELFRHDWFFRGRVRLRSRTERGWYDDGWSRRQRRLFRDGGQRRRERLDDGWSGDRR